MRYNYPKSNMRKSDETLTYAIVGPTAVGKSDYAVELALKVGGEVISADSRQVYRGLNIGTGKITAEEMRGVPHYMLSVADPREVFSVHDYVTLALPILNDIHARGKVAIVCGGTGLYVDTLLGRMTTAPVPPNPTLRSEMESKSLNELQEWLRALDSNKYESVDIANRRRVERAIEIASSLAPQNTSRVQNEIPQVQWLGLTLPLPELKDRISLRLKRRLEAGMMDEARALHASGLSYERMDQLGLEYRYLARHLSSAISYDEMVSALEVQIFKYAKRQLTWFKRNTEIQWLVG